MKKFLIACSIAVLALGFLGTPIQAKPNQDLPEVLRKFFDPTVNESLFVEAWTLVKDSYLDSIPFSEEEISEMREELREAVKANPASKDSIVHRAIRQLVEGLKNPYTWYFDPEEADKIFGPGSHDYSGIGVTFRLLEQKGFSRKARKEPVVVFVNPEGPAKKAGLRQGDVIKAIDEKSIEKLNFREIIDLLRGDKGTVVNLTISRQGKSLSLEITREKIKAKSVMSEMVDNVAYIKITDFSQYAYLQFLDASSLAFRKDCQGVVIDCRFNPGGRVDEAKMILSRWIEGLVATLKFKNEEKKVGTGSSIMPFAAILDLPTVVLINRESASASEILAGAFRDYGRAKIVGETSFGKGCGQTVIPLRDGSVLVLTSFLWETPKGTSINKIGIKPDFEVGFTNKDLLAGRDPQLEKAIELVKTEAQSHNGRIDLETKIPEAKLDSLRENFRKSLGL